MYCRYFLAATLGERERNLRDPRRARARDLAHGEREVGRGHELAGAEEHGAVGVEALGVLARDDEIDRRSAARRKSAAASRRADIGKQVEPLAQFSRRVEAALRQRRVGVVWPRAAEPTPA